jgi:hypothetical protein
MRHAACGKIMVQCKHLVAAAAAAAAFNHFEGTTAQEVFSYKVCRLLLATTTPNNSVD